MKLILTVRKYIVYAMCLGTRLFADPSIMASCCLRFICRLHSRLTLQMREMSHDNLETFLGACIDPPHVCVITALCPKGSLQVRKHTGRQGLLALLDYVSRAHGMGAFVRRPCRNYLRTY